MFRLFPTMQKLSTIPRSQPPKRPGGGGLRAIDLKIAALQFESIFSAFLDPHSRAWPWLKHYPQGMRACYVSSLGFAFAGLCFDRTPFYLRDLAQFAGLSDRPYPELEEMVRLASQFYGRNPDSPAKAQYDRASRANGYFQGGDRPIDRDHMEIIAGHKFKSNRRRRG
jgi:hypothetical protein